MLNNYGYFPTSIKTANALQLQFYVELMKAGEISRTEALDICEIGCGQGHGGIYVLQEFLAATCHYIGLDASEIAICYCQQKHRRIKNASFKVNRQGMPFSDNKFDIVLSVETSVPRFSDQLIEIYRSLKPSGSFIFYETYESQATQVFDDQLHRHGFNLVKKINVTQNIVESMLHDNERKLKYLKKLWFLPPKVKTYLNNYTCMVGSKRFENYHKNHRSGFIYVLRKMPILLIGQIERWDGQNLKGWAYCLKGNQPANLSIIVDGVVIKQIIADISRQDVAENHGSKNVASGFCCPLSLAKDVSHAVRVVCTETGQEISNSPFVIPHHMLG